MERSVALVQMTTLVLMVTERSAQTLQSCNCPTTGGGVESRRVPSHTGEWSSPAEAICGKEQGNQLVFSPFERSTAQTSLLLIVAATLPVKVHQS